MDEFGIGGEVKKFHGLRQQQHRWCCKQHRAGQRHNRANGAWVVRVLVGIVVRRGLLRNRLGNRVRLRKAARVRTIRLCLAGLNSWRRLGRDPVEMPERKRKLDSQREQRQP